MSVDLGQHFLIDREVLGDILNAAELTREDVVLEIGPGKGVLTEALAERAKRVVAVELDRHLAADLQRKFRNVKNVTVVHDDILRWWLQEKFKYFNSVPLKVVANLPYAITSRVLRMFLEEEPRPSLLVVMVQKEVAERICAKPGDMSVLAVSVQYYAEPTIVRIVPRAVFDPQPDVDSAILRISLKKKKTINVTIVTNIDRREEEFFRLVKIGFSSRRKQLHHLLARGLRITNDAAKAALRDIGLSETVRAQELSIDDWRRLTLHLL